MNPFEEWLQKLFAKPPETKKQEDNIFAEGIRKAIATVAQVGLANPLSYVAVDFIRSAGEQQRGNLDKAIKQGISSLSQEEQMNLAMDFGSAVGSIENVGSKVPSWLISSTDYAGRKEALREQLLDAFRRIKHPMEGQAQARRIQHSSREVFPEATLDEARQGQGVGDFWQGTGAAYISEARGVNDYYRKVLSQKRSAQDIKLPSGKTVADPWKVFNDLADKYRSRIYELDKAIVQAKVLGNTELIQKYSDELSKESGNLFTVLSTRKRFTDPNVILPDDPTALRLKELDAAKDRYSEYVEKLKGMTENDPDKKALTQASRATLKTINEIQSELQRPMFTPSVEPRVTTYKGFFYANPDELFNLNIPLKDQAAGERITAALNQLPAGPRVLDYIGYPGVGDYLQAQQSQLRDTPSLASSTINEMIVSGQNPNNAWAGYRPEITDASPWQVMEALKGKGIVGNQYLDKGSMNAFMRQETPTNPTNNYVVTDPSRLRFTDLFAAAPFGMAMQTLQQEQEKKNAKASKPSKK